MSAEVILEPLTIFLSIISGVLVGSSLGLIGGGGSVLAVPLLLYVVGVKDTHVAIGTSALAVGIIAAISLINHRKKRNLDLKKGISFAIPGIAGTLVGSQLGLWTPAENLLVLFAVFMGIVGILMIKRKSSKIEITSGHSGLVLLKKNLSFHGFTVGILAGYFGVGGGFLIVPTMMYSGGLSIVQAIGTSLVSVSSFGFVTAGRYFLEGNIDLVIAMLFVIGGILGSYIGIKASGKIPKENLVHLFAVVLFAIATYIVDQYLGTEVSNDNMHLLKKMGSATAASGAVGLYHIENLTPDAKEKGRKILKDEYQTYVYDDAEQARVLGNFPVEWEGRPEDPTVCLIGCPHNTYQEILWWGQKVTEAVEKRGLKTAAIPTKLFCSHVVRDRLVKEHPLLVGKMTEANMRFTNMCSVSYAGMKGFSERTYGVTNSPKTRNYYPSCRYLTDHVLIDVICTGKIPKNA